jgi:hypothetical protein
MAPVKKLPYKIQSDFKYVDRRTIRELVDTLEPGQSVLLSDYQDVNKARVYMTEVHRKSGKRFRSTREMTGVRVLRLQ